MIENGQKMGKNPLLVPIYAKMGEKQPYFEQKRGILGDFGVFLTHFAKHLIIFDEHLIKITQIRKTFCNNPPNRVI